MKQVFLSFAVLVAMSLFGASAKDMSRVVDIKTPDGTNLKGTYFASAKPGPAVLLYHQEQPDA